MAGSETHTYRATGHIRRERERGCRHHFQATRRIVDDNWLGVDAGGEWMDICPHREEDGGWGDGRSQQY
jgi:hypothetical protein